MLQNALRFSSVFLLEYGMLLSHFVLQVVKSLECFLTGILGLCLMGKHLCNFYHIFTAWAHFHF